MASVMQKKLSEVMAEIRSGEIQIPSFQRDFVWRNQQVKALLDSIRSSIPIGTITLWEQPADSDDTISKALFEPFFAAPIRGGILVYTRKKEVEVTLAVENMEALDTAAKVRTGVIDGRQRLTSLLMAFGGVTRATTQHSGIWCYDLKMDLHGEDSPFVQIQKSDIDRNYKTLSAWIGALKFPLWLWEDTRIFSGQLSNSAHYEGGSIPRDLPQYIERLTELSEVLNRLDIAIYTLDKSIDLSTVCEVFELLNTTGTKVGVFDIVSAKHLGESKSKFILRDRIKSITDPDSPMYSISPLLPRWFDENSGSGGKTACNAVTGAFLGSSDNVDPAKTGESKQLISSFKGADLIKTPLKFYRDFFDVDESGDDVEGFPSLNKLSQHFFNFGSSTCGVTSRIECPYPILMPLYLSLVYDNEVSDASVDPKAIKDSFRVFFWRSSLRGRYDQGFLTGAARDREILKKLLIGSQRDYSDDKPEWWRKLEEGFTKIDLGPTDIPCQIFLDPDTGGAKQKALEAVLFSRFPLDLKTGVALARYQGADVQLHHVFPQKWIDDNCKPKKDMLKTFAALMPLSSTANNDWKAQAPEQVLNSWFGDRLNWTTLESRLISVFINEECFRLLIDSNSSPAERFDSFLQKRASYLTETLNALTKCADLPEQLGAWSRALNEGNNVQ